MCCPAISDALAAAIIVADEIDVIGKSPADSFVVVYMIISLARRISLPFAVRRSKQELVRPETSPPRLRVYADSRWPHLMTN